MKISAIICTRNRSEYLSHAIRSLAGQNLPVDGYEIIVMDNASTDATKSIVMGLTAQISNLRYVYADKPGLSNARNRGLEEASSPIVAFLDDDAIADPGWLSAILEGFDARAQPLCVGGPVRPWWEISRPAWFTDNLLGCHNRDYGATARLYDYPAEQPVGCNMAFLKQPVRDIGGFNPKLERYNDETELISRLVRSDGKLFYHPRAAVQHLVSKERLTLAWQIRRYFEEGKSLGVVAALNGRRNRSQTLRQIGGNLLSIAKHGARLFLSFGPMPARVQRLTHVSTLVGQTVCLTKSLRTQ